VEPFFVLQNRLIPTAAASLSRFRALAASGAEVG